MSAEFWAIIGVGVVLLLAILKLSERLEGIQITLDAIRRKMYGQDY